jgi:hypothetical protein
VISNVLSLSALSVAFLLDSEYTHLKMRSLRNIACKCDIRMVKKHHKLTVALYTFAVSSPATTLDNTSRPG